MQVTIPDIPISPWPERLGHLRVPSTSEAVAIKEIVSVSQSSIVKINEYITQLETTIHQLTVQKDALHTCIREHKALLSPARRIPTEILAHIFNECIDQNNDIQEGKSPLLLSQVCRRWRSIALNTASLWSMINPSHDPSWQNLLWNPNRYSNGAFQMTQTWLERSGSNLLSVYIPRMISDDYESDSDAENSDTGMDEDFVVQQAWNALMPSCARWHSLTMKFYSMSTTLLLQSPHSLASLRRLCISVTRVPADDFSVSLFSDAASLHSLTLNGILPRQLDIPMSSLTDFSGGPEGLTVTNCVEILKSCHALVSCQLHIDPFTIPPDADLIAQTQIQLDHLRHFHLSSRHGFYGLLHCLRFPALQSIGIISPQGSHNAVSDARDFDQMLSHFSNSLEVLLWDLPLDKNIDTFISFLKKLPLLAELDLRGSVDPALFRRLTFDRDNIDTTLCRRLHKLSVLKVEEADLDDVMHLMGMSVSRLTPQLAARREKVIQYNDSLVQLIASRQMAVGGVVQLRIVQLRTVRIHDSSFVEANLPDGLAQLVTKHDGLDIKITRIRLWPL